MAFRLVDTSHNFVMLNGAPSYNSPYTISYWWYFESLPSLPATNSLLQMQVINHRLGAEGEDGIQLKRNPDDGEIHVRLFSTSPTSELLTFGSTIIQAGVWYHFAMVRYSSDALYLYMNGTVEATILTSPGARLPSTRAAWNVATFNTTQAIVRIAVIKVWNQALLKDAVLSEMTTRRPQVVERLIAWFPTYPGSPEHSSDYSGNRYDFAERDFSATLPIVNLPDILADPPVIY